jgi:hypothetical protein
MAKRRGSVIERVLKRVEDHVEEYRAQERVREVDLQAHRAELWAEADERQRLLAEALAEGEADLASLEEITKEQRVVFVLHREDLTGTLEDFAGEKDSLVNVVPGKGDYGGGRGIEGLRGSWLVFEAWR